MTNETLLTIALSVFSFLTATIIALILYIWNRREKQLEAQTKLQEDFNLKFEKHLTFQELMNKNTDRRFDRIEEKLFP